MEEAFWQIMDWMIYFEGSDVQEIPAEAIRPMQNFRFTKMSADSFSEVNLQSSWLWKKMFESGKLLPQLQCGRSLNASLVPLSAVLFSREQHL